MQLSAILEQATGIPSDTYGGGTVMPSGECYHPGVSVKFPDGQVKTVDRVSMWIEREGLRLGMWPGELKKHYQQIYAHPAKVEALIALDATPGWALTANFHLGFFPSVPPQRWYPRQHLSGPDYVRQWVEDFRDERAGGITQSQLADQGFRRWLLERRYADESELSTLDDWPNRNTPHNQVHIRPGMRLLRTWPYPESGMPSLTGDFTAEVRAAIDQALAALGESRLAALHLPAPKTKPVDRAPRAAAPSEQTCPACGIIHAGECF